MDLSKIELDVHTHTLASGHAYSTIQEMAKAASEKGLKLLGITEHAPALPGTCHSIYFRNLHVVPRHMYGVDLLLGAEINIMNPKGEIDMPGDMMRFLDLKIAGIHSLCYKEGTKEENTAGLINVIHNTYIDIISHPGDGTAELCFEPIVIAAKESHTLLEINNSSLKPIRHKESALSNNLEILRLCKRYDVPVILGSDAHVSFDVANYEYLPPLLNETEFPDELIINRSVEAFKSYLFPNV
ncbi:MAG: phosphatase [Duncaniella sp.]|nr:phosphatase [Muribaculum sp.]MCM1255423.1 phosphatase [Duncaniella sp.]